MNRNHLFLALLSGVLISLSWFNFPTALLNLIAFVPLLVIEQKVKNNSDSLRSIILYSSITFFTWSLLTTWWIYNAALIGLIAALFVNTFTMTFTFSMYHWVRKKSMYKISPYSLILWWLAFEYFMLFAEIDYPWLHLGNSFATVTPLIQWYEITGILGGTLLILFTNISVVQLYANYRLNTKKINLYQILGTVLIPLLLFIFSYITYVQHSEKGETIEVVVVQPNIDPYNEKFNNLSDQEQLNRFFNLAKDKITPNTDLIIGPETAITEYLWENQIAEQMSPKAIKSFLKQYPKAAILIGASTRKIYGQNETIPHSARRFNDTAIYYDRFNTGLLFDSTDIQIHHKSKLVVGVEKMPYPQYMKFIESISLDLGGTIGSLGIQDSPTVFIHKNAKIAPVICYESVFGEYVSEYVKKGANVISIITNDGWWGNTPGYKQHLNYAKLRAIENRRSIARSANTGISCFINQRGDIFKDTKWWKPDVIRATLTLNEHVTFYTKHGDFLGRIACYFSVLIFIYSIVIGITSRKQNKKKLAP
ncbi:MAG: apolipoprotein N-acyltransferase [Salinivirgaceae bacterium]|nr:apolipoprotein N-acyltransferase [Salinivirgaceae bacterium]